MTLFSRTSEWLRAAGLLLVVASGCGAADLAGHVLNAIGGTPLRHAVVYLSDDRSMETDGEGAFAFTGLEAGEYVLQASREGFLKGGYGPRRLVPSSITLTQDEHRRDLVIRLAPASVISGRIVDENGDPVPEIYVSAIRPQSGQRTPEPLDAGSILTNDRGEFRIAKLEPGRYLVRTGRWGPIGDTFYPAVFYPGSQEQSSAVAVQVPLGGEARGIDIALTPAKGYLISGKLVKPAGTAAVIAWERNGAFRQQAGNIAADQNKFELHGMAPGHYILYAEPEDSDWEGGGRQIVDVSNRNVDGVVIPMVAAVDIHGRVRVHDAATPPDLKKLSIEAHTSAIFFPQAVTVADDGTFALKNMVAGRFGLNVTDLPENCFVKSILYGG